MSTGGWQVWCRTFSRPWSAVYPGMCEMVLTLQLRDNWWQTFLCEVFCTVRKHIFLDRLVIKTATQGLRGKKFSSCFYVNRQKETMIYLEPLRKSVVHRPVSFWCIIQRPHSHSPHLCAQTHHNRVNCLEQGCSLPQLFSKCCIRTTKLQGHAQDRAPSGSSKFCQKEAVSGK